MKINNSLLLSLLLRDCPDIASSLLQTVAYIYIYDHRTHLVLRCPNMAIASHLLYYGQHIADKLQSLLPFEIQLELSAKAIGELNMVVAERTERIENNTTTQTRLINIETLSRATNKSIQEVKLLLAQARAPIYPQIDGSEAIAETVFDAVLLSWAKSLKEGERGDREGRGDRGEFISPTSSSSSSPSSVEPSTLKSPSKPRKPSTRILNEELSLEDIAIVKSGKSAGSPNLTNNGIQTTLTNFFNKVRLEDTTRIDAVCAFVEGTSEFGLALRKKLLGAYKKFFKNLNLTDVEIKFIAGAKVYLEKLVKPQEQTEVAIEAEQAEA